LDLRWECSNETQQKWHLQRSSADFGTKRAPPRFKLGREVGDRYAAMGLPSPTVSRLHATLHREAVGYLLQDQSTNGTFVNQKQIDGVCILKEQDAIQIGPFTLLLREGILELVDRGDQIRLDAHRLVRKVKAGSSEKVILNDVSLGIEPGQLVA
jgi:ABC transport system ATP-binding/permease protein